MHTNKQGIVSRVFSPKIIISLLIALGAISALPTQAVAQSFDQNYLIDDALFVDTDSMTVPQIQSFLEERGSLLANWVDNVDMRRPSDNCIVHHATGMTAAEIIHEASTAWNAQVYDSNGCAIENAYWGDPAYSNYTLETVSPKVLLVTLQKEQSLVTADGSYSTNPADYQSPACCSSNEYKLARAMGYGVPDSGGINEKYLGFYNQINWAAWQLRFNYERSAGNTAWDEVGYITYSGPMIEGTWRRCASCSEETFDGFYPIDGTPLYMENRATASLYYYTPHTYPGFFGNYNFVQFYTQWFGSPTSEPSYAWSLLSQEVFEDSTEAVQLSSNPTLSYRDSAYIKLTVRNDGNQVWDSNVRIGAAGPNNRTSSFCDTSSWITCSRPTQLSGGNVAPGETATFGFTISTGEVSGSFYERFRLLKEGQQWFPGTTINVLFNVAAPEYYGQFTSEKYFASTAQVNEIPRTAFKNGHQYYAVYKVKNIGTETWVNTGPNAATLGTKNNVPSGLCDPSWPNCIRPAVLSEASVAPGETGTFEFWMTTPFRDNGFEFIEEFQILREGIAWFERPAIFTKQIMNTPLTAWQILSVDAYTDDSEAVSKDLLTLAKNERAYVVIQVRNLSGATWNQAGSQPTYLATNNPRNRSSVVCDATWLNCARPTRLEEASVAPGDIGTYKFWIEAPNHARQNFENFILVRENAYWLGNAGLKFEILVQ